MKSEENQMRTFFKHVALVTKQRKDRDEAKAKMQYQIEKVKKIAIANKQIKSLEDEIKELEKIVLEVIEKEKKISHVAVKKPSLAKLRKRVLDLEFEHDDHERQIKMLETKLGLIKDSGVVKVKSKKPVKSDIKLIESSLKKLEKRYNILKKNKKKSKELSALKKRITNSKKILKKLKV